MGVHASTHMSAGHESRKTIKSNGLNGSRIDSIILCVCVRAPQHVVAYYQYLVVAIAKRSMAWL